MVIPYGRLVVSDGTSCQAEAVVTVRRTVYGVEEALTGMGVAGPPGMDMTLITSRAVRLLQAVAAAVPIPAVGMVGVTHGGPRIGFRLPTTGGVVPVAVLVGPYASRLVGVDVDRFAASYGGVVAGRGKFPSLIVPLTGRAVDPWQYLTTMMGEVDPDRLVMALRGDSHAV
jgi:hypothetical protein